MRCTVCEGDSIRTFLDLEEVPVSCNSLCATREEALATPKGQLRLGYCRECGHVFNVAFDPGRVEYAPGYENSLDFSGRFREYADALADELVRRYRLRGKDVVEIGCGRGDFLARLCARGDNRGWGFDPSHPDGEAPCESVRIVRAYYDRDCADVPADIVCCRHCLEHVPEPVSLLRAVRDALEDRPGTPVFFEVPNLIYTLRDGGVWDLIYEHCSYFSPGSLARAFEEAGLAVTEVRDAFGGQFLVIHGVGGMQITSSRAGGAEPPELESLVEAFGERYQRRIAGWRERLRRLSSDGRRIAVWGAGSKGATFLNLLDPGCAVIDRVVDVNPHKHGCFVPGTGHEIVAPAGLEEEPPEAVIVMNPNYADEILADMRGMGIEAELLLA